MSASFARILIALVDVPEGRLAAVRAARVETIGKTAKVVGQLQAINVEAKTDGRYLLIAGAKRLAALDLAGETLIDAMVHPVGSLSDDQRRLIEIIENIDRQALTALEHAEHLAAMKEIHERLYPQTRKGGDRRSEAARAARADQSELFSFRSKAAEMVGLSKRAIEIAVGIAHGLSEASKARIRETWLEDHHAGLRQLADLDPAQQDRVCDLLFSDPPGAGSVADAVLIAEGKRLLTTSEKLYASTMGNWARFSEPQKTAFLDLQEEAIRKHAAMRGWFK